MPTYAAGPTTPVSVSEHNKSSTNNANASTVPPVTLSMRKGGPSFMERPTPVMGARGIPFGHIHDGGILPWEGHDENGDPSYDPMELTPEGSGSTFGRQASREPNSDTVMTPPRSDHESPGTQAAKSRQGSMAQSQQQSQQQPPPQDASADMDTQPTSTSYGLPGQYNGSESVDFGQLLQMTPGLANIQLPTGWESMQIPGLTPGTSIPDAEEFQKMMQDMSSWEGGEPLVGDQWYMNGPR